ncbi:MAG: addiction module protein [Verrucomicrobiales bacterium]
MVATVDSILQDALALPGDARLQLVEKLIPTLWEDAPVSDAHRNVLNRREQEIASRSIKPIPGDQVMRSVREALRGTGARSRKEAAEAGCLNL